MVQLDQKTPNSHHSSPHDSPHSSHEPHSDTDQDIGVDLEIPSPLQKQVSAFQGRRRSVTFGEDEINLILPHPNHSDDGDEAHGDDDGHSPSIHHLLKEFNSELPPGLDPQNRANAHRAERELREKMEAEKQQKRRNSLTSVDALCGTGVFTNRVISYLSTEYSVKCRRVNSFLNSVLREPCAVNLSHLPSVLVFYRDLSVGNLDNSEVVKQGIIGGGYLNQRDIGALNSSCKDLKLASEVCLSSKNNKPLTLSTFCRDGKRRCATQPSRMLAIAASLARSKIIKAWPLGQSMNATQQTSPPPAIERRAMVTPEAVQLNFNQISSSSMALTILKRTDPRMVTKVNGSLTFRQEGLRRQCVVTGRSDVAMEMCEALPFMKNLVTLDLSNWPINDQWLNLFSKKLSEGTFLKLNEVRLTYPLSDSRGSRSQAYAVSGTALTSMCTAMKDHLPALEVLDMSGIVIRNDVSQPLVDFITSSFTLKKAWFRGTKLGDSFINKVIDALKAKRDSIEDDVQAGSALTHISLQDCLVTNEGLIALTQFYNEMVRDSPPTSNARMRRSKSEGAIQLQLRRSDSDGLQCRSLMQKTPPRVLLGGNRLSREVKAGVNHLEAYITVT